MFPNRTGGPLVIPNCTRCTRAVRRESSINRDALDALHGALDMVVVPHLAQHCVSVITRALAGLGLVVPRPRTADVRQLPELARESVLDVRDGIPRLVRWQDAALGEPLPRRHLLVVRHHGAEEVGHLLVARVRGAVALRVEGAEARRVLAELVRPEDPAFLVQTRPESMGV